MLWDHRENWSFLEEEEDFLKEPTMNAWKNDDFEQTREALKCMIES